MSRQHHPADPERLGTNAIHDHLQHRARQIRRVTVSERFGAHRGPAAFSSARPAAAPQRPSTVKQGYRHHRREDPPVDTTHWCPDLQDGRNQYLFGARGSGGRTGCNRTGCAGSSCRSTRSRPHGKPFVWPAHPARIIAAVERGALRAHDGLRHNYATSTRPSHSSRDCAAGQHRCPSVRRRDKRVAGWVSRRAAE